MFTEESSDFLIHQKFLLWVAYLNFVVSISFWGQSVHLSQNLHQVTSVENV